FQMADTHSFRYSMRGSSVLVAERRVEGCLRQLPEQRADESDGFLRAVQPVHASVFPLDGNGAGVADRAERPEGVLPRHVAVTGRDKVPAAPRVAPRQVRSEYPRATVLRSHPRVLAVDVV